MISARIHSYRHFGASQDLFRGVEFVIERGAFVSIVGVSGVGKTTLLSILAGIAPGRLESDIVFTKGKEALTTSEARRRGSVALLQQRPSLLPWLNVAQNLNLPAELSSSLEPKPLADVERLLEKVGLNTMVLNQWPDQLSGGMLQRVAIAQLLLYRPEVLMLDEPFGNLDAWTGSQLASLLKEHCKEFGTTCVLVSHDIAQAEQMSSLVMLLRPNGSIELLQKPIDRDELLSKLRADLLCLGNGLIR